MPVLEGPVLPPLPATQSCPQEEIALTRPLPGVMEMVAMTLAAVGCGIIVSTTPAALSGRLVKWLADWEIRLPLSWADDRAQKMLSSWLPQWPFKV